jgi:hypothetical protein
MALVWVKTSSFPSEANNPISTKVATSLHALGPFRAWTCKQTMQLQDRKVFDANLSCSGTPRRCCRRKARSSVDLDPS